MLHPHVSDTSPTAEDRERRVQELTGQILPRLQQAARQMAEALVDLPDHQLLGDIEFTLRDQAHRLASDLHQTGLDGRKKGATAAPARSAPTARPTPASRATGRAPS